MLRTADIDHKVLQLIDPVAYFDQVFQVNFRWYQPREYKFENICQEFQLTTYSNKWNAISETIVLKKLGDKEKRYMPIMDIGKRTY